MGKVVGVADGYTIKVLWSKEQVKIRLYGIDIPRKAQAFGNKTKKFTDSLVSRKIVDVESVSKDRYGHAVALVRITINRVGYVNLDGADQEFNEKIVSSCCMALIYD